MLYGQNFIAWKKKLNTRMQWKKYLKCKNNLIQDNQYKLTFCNGSPNSELEDSIKKEIYEKVKNKFRTIFKKHNCPNEKKTLTSNN